MPYAKGPGLHQVDVPLSNYSVKYANALDGYVVPKLTKLPVNKETGKYYIFGKENYNVPDTLRANGAPSNRDNYQVSTSTYGLERHSLHDVITDRDVDNADEGLNPELDATENLTEKIMIRMDIQAKAILFASTTFTNNASLTSTMKWTTLTTGTDPIGDCATATTVIMGYTGKVANTLIVGWPAHNKLKEHPNILERIKYSERGIITEEIIKAVLDKQNYIVGSTVYDSKAEGASGGASLSYVWDTNAVVAYMEPTARLKSPSAIFNFIKTPQNESPFKVKKWRDEAVEGNVIEVNAFSKVHTPATSGGYLIQGVN